MDDIVTRLRNWHDQRDSWQTLTEAADEIQRLRALLEHGLTQGYGCKGCDLCTELKAINIKAVHNA